MIVGLLKSDLKNIVRDPVLALLSVVPILVGLLMRFLMPLITGWVAHRVDLTEHYVLITGFLLLLTPSMYGWVVGFMLLDERDEDILTVISVTPIGRDGFLIYRLALPVLLGFFGGFIVVPLAGLIPFSDIGLLLIPISLLAALGAPMMTLFLAAFARNKVEGMAVGKGASLTFLAPMALLFADSPLHYLAGLLPTFWVVKAFAVGVGGNLLLFFFVISIGFLVNGALIGLLHRRFARQAG